jgi:hypothetical protein
LQKFDGTAILFVQGNHFVAADPRERKETASHDLSIRIYDETVAKWVTRQDLEAMKWDGTALTLRRQIGPSDGPKAVFDKLLQDIGTQRSGLLFPVVYQVQNVGSKPLEIKDVRTNCGCASAQASERSIAPGQVATVTLEVDLTLKNGDFDTSAIVSTNDPLQPVFRLKLQGNSYVKPVIWERQITLGDIAGGSTMVRQLVVHTPGAPAFAVTKCEFEPDSPDQKFAKGVELHADWRPWNPEAEFERSSFGRVSEGRLGDVVLNLRVNTTQDAMPQVFTARAMVEVKEADRSYTMPVALRGRIVDPQGFEPAALVFRCDSKTTTSMRRSVTLKGAGTASFAGFEKGNLPLKITYNTGILDVELIRPDVKTGVISGEIACRLTNGRSVSLPVLIECE